MILDGRAVSCYHRYTHKNITIVWRKHHEEEIAALILCVSLTLSLFGCAAPGGSSSQASSAEASSAAASSQEEADDVSSQEDASSQQEPEEQAAFPVTVTDAAGREVTIEAFRWA